MLSRMTLRRRLSWPALIKWDPASAGLSCPSNPSRNIPVASTFQNIWLALARSTLKQAQRKRPSTRLYATLCALLWLSGGVAQAATVAGIKFAEQRAYDGNVLPLRGAGLLTRYLVIKAYGSAFYLPATAASYAFATDVPKCLQIAYLVDIDGKAFGPAGEEVLARMVDTARLRALQPQLRAIGKAYVDVKKGDRYELCYAPGKGTSLALNDKVLTTIPGAEFAAVYFHIWLGRDPVDRNLRDQLLALKH